MKNKLLSTTALMTAAVLSSVATADVSITGMMEFTYESLDKGNQTTGASDDRFHTDQEINIMSSTKTDSGLEVGVVLTLQAAGQNASITGNSAVTSSGQIAGFGANTGLNAEETYMYIKGGFGTLQLGGNDGAGDQLTRTAHDLIGPDALNDGGGSFHAMTGTSTGGRNLADDNADLINDIDDENNITYILPKMGGLTLGASYKDAGDASAENADETVVAAMYEFTSGDIKSSVHYGYNSISGTVAGGGSLNSQTVGVDVSSGPIRAVFAQAQSDVTTAIETKVVDYGLQYTLGNGIVLSYVGTQVTENTGGESLDVTTISAKYNIASGLDAYLTYHDYDYKIGTGDGTADDGSSTHITIKTTF